MVCSVTYVEPSLFGLNNSVYPSDNFPVVIPVPKSPIACPISCVFTFSNSLYIVILFVLGSYSPSFPNSSISSSSRISYTNWIVFNVSHNSSEF